MSWVPTKEVGDLCEVSHGSTPSKAEPRYWGGTLAWVSPKDMWVNRISDAEDHLTGDATNEARAPIAEVGSILVVVRSGILVRRLPVAITDRRVSFNQDIKALFPDKSRLLPEYLWRFLQSCEQEVLACGVKKGATVHSVKSGYIEGMRIPLPDLREQARIVELLDHADVLRRQRADADAKLARLLPALFHHHFGDPVSNDRQWPTEALTKICEPRQWPTISQKELIESGYIVYGANGPIGHYSEFNHEDPTVLVTCRGATCGTINVSPPKCYVTGNAMSLDNPDPARTTNEFLEVFLQTRGLSDTITGAAQPQITRANLKVVQVFTPPMPLVVRFSSQVRETKQVLTHAAASAAKIETLFQNLLHRAFTGELTAKWREAHLSEGVQEMSRVARS
jgi:restriction endonuclease S subunit